MPQASQSSTLFPYTTLFRSASAGENQVRISGQLGASGSPVEAVAVALGMQEAAHQQFRFCVLTPDPGHVPRSEEHTSELQSPCNLVCRHLLEKKDNECSR